MYIQESCTIMYSQGLLNFWQIKRFDCGVLDWRGEAGQAPSREELSRQCGKQARPPQPNLIISKHTKSQLIDYIYIYTYENLETSPRLCQASGAGPPPAKHPCGSFSLNFRPLRLLGHVLSRVVRAGKPQVITIVVTTHGLPT